MYTFWQLLCHYCALAFYEGIVLYFEGRTYHYKKMCGCRDEVCPGY